MADTTFDARLAALRAHAAHVPSDMRAAFASDPGRFAKLSAAQEDMVLDWSKCAVTGETMALLEQLALAADVPGKRDAMFAGRKINITENRAVLHTALRRPRGERLVLDGHEIIADVHAVLDAMAAFADDVRSGTAAGATGKKITDVVNIGIGGSDLGPAMATLALAPWHDGPRAHYVSNVDGAHIHDVTKNLDPATTLFIVASKTFTTIETMTNAETARNWIANALGKAAVGHHFAAVSTALDKVAACGRKSERVVGFWDWFGGRSSVWSAFGRPVMLAVRPERFGEFLAGGHGMVLHFSTAPVLKTLRGVLDLVGFGLRVVGGYPAGAVIPYAQLL